MGQTQVRSGQVLDGSLTDADVSSANKDGTAATPSLRTLGTGAQQAAAGNDSRFTATVPESRGGTNQTTYAAGDILYASATNTLAKLAKGSEGNLLQCGGSAPSWVGPPQAHINGLTLAWVSTTSFSVATGQATDSINSIMMTRGAITKTTAAWAVGTSQGGLDTGTIAASTWYHVWLIRRSDTGVTDILFSLSASAPTMPTNYDARRLIGSILTNASSQFVPFDQLGEEFIWRDPVADVAVSNLSTASVSYTLTVPTGLAVTALIFGGGFNASANVAVYVRSLTQTDTAPSNTFYTFKNPVANSQAGSQFAAAVVTNTSAQIAARASAASTSLNILTRGFIHPRGRNA